RKNRLAVRPFIALNTKRVQLGDDDLRHGLHERGRSQEVVQIRLVWLREAMPVVDVENDLLGEAPKFGDCALRVRIGVTLGECAESRQICPSRAQEFKGLR